MNRGEKGRGLLLLVVLVAGAMVISSCGSSGNQAGGTGKATLAELVGNVTVNGKASKPPAELSPGDVVRAESGGLARIHYSDGTRFLLLGKNKEPAELTIGKVSVDNGAKVMLVNLAKGVLSFLVRTDQKEARYEIEAVSSLTVVRGTEGKVETGATGDKVALKSGKVEVMSKAGRTSSVLNGGFQMDVSPTGELGTPRAYDFSVDAERELYDIGPLKMKTFEGQRN